MDRTEFYRRHLFEGIPRILSSLNRDPLSDTYGCFDRQYWSWCSVDFPNADLQRGVYPLTRVWLLDEPGNPYHRHPKILEWIGAGLAFWRKIQHPNGFFDQWYPNEQSVGTTAFTLGPAAACVRDLSGALPPDLTASLVESFRRAGDRLLRLKETHGFISNHIAGAAWALLEIHRLTSDDRYKHGARKLLDDIAARQSSEGWFSEYGGADPGYETLGISYLAKCIALLPDPEWIVRLERSIEFLSYAVHPNGSVGGEYGNRNTEIFFAAGLEMLSDRVPAAESILARMISDSGVKFPRPHEVDACNFTVFLSQFADAYACSRSRSHRPAPPPALPFHKTFAKEFPEAGWFIQSTDTYYAVVNIRKGGLIRLYDKKTGRLADGDCGLAAADGDGRWIVTQSAAARGSVRHEGPVTVLKVEGDFHRPPNRRMTPVKLMLLRAFALTLGRTVFFCEWAKQAMARALILRRETVPVSFTREIRLEPGQVSITDAVPGEGRRRIRELYRVLKSTPFFMGSARYFTSQELDLRREDLEKLNLADQQWVRRIGFPQSP
ncbi:hypothetical protein HY522_00905 [bacterium]|nr:hypothetical protein [bacterium]